MRSLHGKFVLIVDDDQAMLRALTKALTCEGGLVTGANWVGEAMDHLTDKFEGFDLIITDLRMPILSGETILRTVKNAMPYVPVIVITGFGNPSLKAECLRNGAAAFLEKPLQTPELLEAIDNALVACRTDETRQPWVENKPDGSNHFICNDATKTGTGG